ncbi:MAG: hypothetical protein WBC68_00575 [Albidovulum sp.]
MVTALERLGWVRYPKDPALLEWAAAALPFARQALAERAAPLRCGGTWDVGLEALPNDHAGQVADVPLAGRVIDEINGRFGVRPLHRAQVSTVFPGYPRPWDAESEAAYRYRLKRDAAHVDGILPEGPNRRRMIREPHAWILGLPLTDAGPGASPPVVWEGSHKIIARALHAALAEHDETIWPDVDVTEAYHAARREVFETCKKVALHARPGEAVLIHRLALHGIQPWQKDTDAPDEARIIAYFRPELAGGIKEWIADTQDTYRARNSVGR